MQREKFLYDVVAGKANSLKDIEGACIWINETAIMIGPHEISLYYSCSLTLFGLELNSDTRL